MLNTDNLASAWVPLIRIVNVCPISLYYSTLQVSSQQRRSACQSLGSCQCEFSTGHAHPCNRSTSCHFPSELVSSKWLTASFPPCSHRVTDDSVPTWTDMPDKKTLWRAECDKQKQHKPLKFQNDKDCMTKTCPAMFRKQTWGRKPEHSISCGNELFLTSKLTRTVTTNFSQGGNLAIILVIKDAIVSP